MAPLKICMERCGAHTKTEWLLLFISSIFFISSFIDHRRERQCAVMQDLYFDLRHSDVGRRSRKKVFFSFSSFRYHTIMALCIENARTLSSQQPQQQRRQLGSRIIQVYYSFFFVDVRCGATGSHCASVRYTFFFFFIFRFGIIFIINCSPLISRFALHIRVSHVTQTFLKAIILCY